MRGGLTARHALAGVVLLCAAAPPSGAQPVAGQDRGALLAQTYCAACHAVDRYGTGSSFATPPSFATIARDPNMTPFAIRRTISVSHTLMPKLALSERDKDALIAYVQSMRDGPD
jgi:mono/diheme cytochrome c family protein